MAHEGQKIASKLWFMQLSDDATGTSVVSGTVGTPGTGYVTAPTVAFAAPPAGGTQATGTSTIAGGAVTGIVITNPGLGYVVAPAITLTGGGGTAAAATSVLGANYLTTICEKGTSFKTSRDEIDNSSKCGNDISPGDKTTESLQTGLYVIQAPNVGLTSEASYLKLWGWYKAGTTLYYRLGPLGTLATGALRTTGTCWIKDLDLKADFGGHVECTANFVGYPDNTVLAVG